jgi:hypothetical protein
MSERTAEQEQQAQQDWFARELGREWVTDGDGVYHHVGGGRPAPDEVEDLLDPSDP